MEVDRYVLGGADGAQCCYADDGGDVIPQVASKLLHGAKQRFYYDFIRETYRMTHF